MVWLSKTQNDKKAKLSYMDTYSFIEYIKTDDIYKDIAEDLALQIMNLNAIPLKGRYQNRKIKK